MTFKERNTPERLNKRFADPVEGSTRIYAGNLVSLNSAGRAIQATAETSIVIRGVAMSTVDNRDGSAGDLTIESEIGAFRFTNASTDPIERTDIGAMAYLVDAETVGAGNAEGTLLPVGRIVDIDAGGVWVDITPVKTVVESTPVPAWHVSQFSDPIAAGETITAGDLVVLDASGNAISGEAGTDLTARGVALATVDNSGGSAGDADVVSAIGTYRFANSSTDAIDRTDIGGTAYIEDATTVAATDGTGTLSPAGKIVDIDDTGGVWINIG